MDGSDPKNLELPEEFQQSVLKMRVGSGGGRRAAVTGTVISLCRIL